MYKYITPWTRVTYTCINIYIYIYIYIYMYTYMGTHHNRGWLQTEIGLQTTNTGFAKYAFGTVENTFLLLNLLWLARWQYRISITGRFYVRSQEGFMLVQFCLTCRINGGHEQDWTDVYSDPPWAQIQFSQPSKATYFSTGPENHTSPSLWYFSPNAGRWRP